MLVAAVDGALLGLGQEFRDEDVAADGGEEGVEVGGGGWLKAWQSWFFWGAGEG